MRPLTPIFRESTSLILHTHASIYLVHDDAKEKEFELEMSWIGDESNGVHLPVPKDLHDEAEQKAKEQLETFSE